MSDRSAAVRTAVVGELVKKGFDEVRARVAAAHIVNATAARFVAADSDEITTGNAGKSLGEGVAAFLATDEGKAIMPPPKPRDEALELGRDVIREITGGNLPRADAEGRFELADGRRVGPLVASLVGHGQRGGR